MTPGAEKCSMGSNTLLNMTVILLIVSGLMPRSAKQFPLLGWFTVVGSMCSKANRPRGRNRRGRTHT